MAIRKNAIRSMVVAATLMATAAAHAAECAPEISQAIDMQRQQYIEGQASLADKNFSRRPGSFASTTCLDKLMQGGGMDIFFKPPSLDSMLNMVKELACQQASQIFDQIVGGSGVNGVQSLLSGEIAQGVNLGSNLLQSIGGGSFSVSPSTSNAQTSLRSLFQ